MSDLNGAITRIVAAIICVAPIGILGIVASTIAETGFETPASCGHLLLVLIGCMACTAVGSCKPGDPCRCTWA